MPKILIVGEMCTVSKVREMLDKLDAQEEIYDVVIVPGNNLETIKNISPQPYVVNAKSGENAQPSYSRKCNWNNYIRYF